jgi:YfiH family protein
MLKRRNIAGISCFVFPDLERNPHFTHAITGRQLSADTAENETANLKLLERLGIPGDRLVLLHQVHGAETVVLGDGQSAFRPGERPEADGVIMTAPGLFGAIRTADCVPVIAQLPDRHSVGVFHAGWRGACSRIVERGLRRLLELTDADPSELVVAIGPSIRRCCYEVGEDVREAFLKAGHSREIFDGRFLDLPGAICLQARAVGAGIILDSGMCSACRNDLFYSYRKEKTPLRTWTVAGYGG